MSENRTSSIASLLALFIVLGASVPWAFCAELAAVPGPEGPTRYARTLTIDSRGRLWASFMNEQGLDTWGIACLETASPTLVSAAMLSVGRVFALRALENGSVAAATDKGLRVLAPDGRFESIGKQEPLSLLAGTACGAVLAAGTGEDRALVLVRFTPGRPSERWRLPAKGAGGFREPLRMFELPDGRVMIVFATDVVMLDGGKLRRLAWEKTPLASPAKSRSSERRVPPVWIYDAAMTPDGSVFFVGFCKKLVRWKDGRFDVLAEGHFQDLAADPASETVWVTDFAGALRTWSGKTLETAYRLPDGEIRNIWPAASDALWLECAPASGPHRLERLSPGSADPNAVSLEFRPGLLSPGVLSLVQAADGAALIATNEGLWRIFSRKQTTEANPGPAIVLPERSLKRE
ncbi:hypothetical protein KBA41_15145 [Candidatus Ozemobacteraceae bacterium]|nr:hypothetical protein [Candidatus Ozemobacteraceae bacterium]